MARVGVGHCVVDGFVFGSVRFVIICAIVGGICVANVVICAIVGGGRCLL